MFEMKGTHLALQRVGRGLLKPFGLTPARFDLMRAIGARWVKQSDLWRRLNVVRSAVCEMVHALEVLGWVRRVRAADSRTWLVKLTRRGRALYDSAHDRCIESGDATLSVDRGLADEHVEVDTRRVREEVLLICDAVQRVFRARPRARGDLYPWRPEDYYFWLIDAADHESNDGDIPFVTVNW